MDSRLNSKSFVVGLSARTILVCALLVAVWVIITQFKTTTDLGVFFPASKTPTEKVLIKLLGKGATSKLLFVSISGADEQLLREKNKALAAQLRSSSHYARVLNGEHSINETDRDLIFKYRYLAAPLDIEHAFSVEGLHQALEARLRGLASSTAAFEKSFLAADPVGASKLFIDQLLASQDETGPLRIDNVWMSRDRKRSLMILEMQSDMFDVGGQAAALAELKSEFAAKNDDDLTLSITGPGAFSVETRDTIAADVRLLTVLAIVFVVSFLFLAFRSLLFLFLVTVPLVLGVVAAVASVLLVFGSIHGVTLAFGITLSGVAVDYPIHLVSQMMGTQVKARDHVKRIWPTLRLGVLTTTIAYASLIFSDFEGLTQLGIFTVTGLLMAAAVTRWLLPHIMPNRVAVGQGMERWHDFLERLGRKAPQARIWMTLLVVFASAYLLLLDRPLRDNRLDSLSPIPEERRAADRSLRQDLGMWSGAKLIAIVAPNAETALRMSEKLMPVLNSYVQRGWLADFDAAAQYLPSKQLQLSRQSLLPAEGILRKRLDEALEGLPFRRDIFDPFIVDVEQTKKIKPVTLETLRDTNLVPLLSPLLFELDGKWIAPILLHGVKDTERVAELAAEDNGVSIIYLDLKRASDEVMQTAMSHVLRLLAWGAVFIYLVLAFSFRDAQKPLYILAPTIASVIVVTAILAIAQIQLTVFHLVSLLLVVGLGLDYALFFNRLTHSVNEWATTFKALWVCCITTVLVFSMLLLSHTPPLQAVGLTVSIGAALCLIFGAVWSSSTPTRGKRWRKKKRLLKTKGTRATLQQ